MPRHRTSAPGGPSSAPPTKPARAPSGPPPVPREDPLRDYHRIADTVGGLPNLRWKDNVFQAVFVLMVGIIGAGVGYGAGGVPGLLVGGLVGVLGSVILSGIVLMVLGWVRTLRR